MKKQEKQNRQYMLLDWYCNATYQCSAISALNVLESVQAGGYKLLLFQTRMALKCDSDDLYYTACICANRLGYGKGRKYENIWAYIQRKRELCK